LFLILETNEERFFYEEVNTLLRNDLDYFLFLETKVNNSIAK
jgi:hypothetical protein